jgi:hypothetical protein
MLEVDLKTYYLVYVTDATDFSEAFSTKMQKKFQVKFTNGLSHERLGPLNSSINLTDIVLRKCDQVLEEISVQGSNPVPMLNEQLLVFCKFIQKNTKIVWS